MNQLPIQKLTLYKQGIGYFERKGKFDGSTLPLIIPRDNINDTLKSLHIETQEGGKVLGVDYETPSDKERLLSELSIKLNEKSNLIDLMHSLRGVSLIFKLKKGDSVSGRLIGVETSLSPSIDTAMAIMQDEDKPSKLNVVSIGDIQTVTLQSDKATSDISFFLDLSQTEQSRATITIRLSEGSHTLNISYLAPSPTWRVSYQLISEKPGEARLTGWGVFDNKLDEDLENVTLILISGRPISFEYDLYESYTPSRPQVSDDPTAMESVSTDPRFAESLATLSHEIRTPLTSIKGYATILKKEMDGPLSESQKQIVDVIEKNSQRLSELLNDLLEMARLREGRYGRIDYRSTIRYGSGPLGDLKVSSSYFMPMLIGNAEAEYLTYQVESPVSVKRKQSAMVPIFDHPISYQEIIVYNGDKMPNHPLRVWKMRNATGKALEQGPVTLVNEGKYQGEGLIPFTGLGDEVQIPFALEFGVVVNEEQNQQREIVSNVQFNNTKKTAEVTRQNVTEVVYKVKSHIEKETIVFIERRNPSWGEYFETAEPVDSILGHSRWQISVPANEETAFSIKIRTAHTHEEDITKWEMDFVKGLISRSVIDGRTADKFEEYWAGTTNEKASVEFAKMLQNEYTLLLTSQVQLRDNLGALGNSDREIEIRNQILEDLAKSEGRRRELEIESYSLTEKLKKIKESQSAIIESIYEGTK